MNSAISNQHSAFSSRKIILICLLLAAYCLLLSCGQPVLESPKCIESRTAVKRFYSFHFGNDMKPSEENLKKRQEFLSSNLRENLRQQSAEATDYFTQTDDYPKAFRAGKCETKGDNKTEFEILLFWRTNETNIQREIAVEMIKESGNWLINNVKSK